MKKEEKIIVFQNQKIRRIWHEGEWWFVIEDIISALTDSKDPKQYAQKLKQRDEILNKGWVQFVHTLLIDTTGGKQKINCANTKSIFRIIQSIPSKKAEPFKLWLAKVGYERVLEIENPELAQDRVREYYLKKGYPKDWVEKRIRGIAIRQELTNEWKERGIEEQRDFAILTNEIAKETFGVTIQEHKKIKKLNPKFSNENLRDHMDDLELIFSMLGEASTTEISRGTNAQGFKENQVAAKKGGRIAGDARKKLEKESGKKVVSEESYLENIKKLKPIKKVKKKIKGLIKK